MDLTRKGKSWAGNAFHRFESICQGVDDFMSKDTMWFVENQLQSVGTSVARLYSHVVPDVHPPSKDDDQGITIGSGKQLSENHGRNGNSGKSVAPLAIGVETDAIFDEICKNLTPVMHVEGLIAEDHKNNSRGDVLSDSSLCMVEDPKSDESGSRPNTRVSKAPHKMGSPASGIDWTLCDVSSEDESFDETRAVDELPDLTLESNGITFSIDGSDFVSDFSGKRDKDVLSGVEMIPSETDTNVMHLDMETIDLSPDMNTDETSMILNGNSVHAASHGKRNFRYYKKLIRDALTSRQRLSKEYEHLAILHGDIKSEPSHLFVPISVTSSTNTSVHATRSQSFHEMCETEWELV